MNQAPGKGRDNNLRAAYLHVLADAMTSVLAIVALLVGRGYGWAWADPAMGVVGALVIVHWSWGLIRDLGQCVARCQQRGRGSTARNPESAGADRKPDHRSPCLAPWLFLWVGIDMA